MSGLVYEVVWIRLLSHWLGSTTLAISVVLASFMAGLALGSYVLGGRGDQTDRPLRLYAVLEIAVAVLAALVPFANGVCRSLYVEIAHSLPQSGQSVVGILLVFLMLLPATFCMGGTLPVLSRFFVESRAKMGQGIGLLYAANTIGAVAGVALAGFLLIPALGVYGSIAIGIGGNVIAAVAALGIGRSASVVGMAQGEPKTPARGGRKARAPEPVLELRTSILMLAFAISGFVALGLELYWTRALHHFLGNSTYAFSAMLTTFLVGLAFGGAIGGRIADRVGSPTRVLAWILIGIGFASVATVPVIWNLLPNLEGKDFFSAANLSWSAYIGRRFAVAFAIMFIPTLLSGMAFPLVNRIGILNLDNLGKRVGRFYGANTVGAILGSLVAAFVMLPLLGTRRALLATALLAACAGLGVHLANRRKRSSDTFAAVGLLAVLVFAVPILNQRAKTILSDTQHASDRVIFDREDPTAQTRVYRKRNGELHMSVDGRHIGGTEPGTVRKEKALAHIPVALTDNANNVLAVGLGSGITLGALALYAEVETLTCVEIVPNVIVGAQQFRESNRNVLHDPRVRMIHDDGIHYLLTTQERFDVISSDSKLNPEYPGNSSLLSRDYYELCRERLRERGVMVQWMPVHVPHNTIRLVARSFVEAFPFVELFWIDPQELILVGSRSRIRFDFERWNARRAEPLVFADLTNLNMDNPYALVTSRVAGRDALQAALGEGEVNSWHRPVYEFRVVREFRLKPGSEHEDDNLKWLAGLYTQDGLEVTGRFDDEKLRRFHQSSRQLLWGFAQGGGTGRLENGRSRFEEGLQFNPDDIRLSAVLERLTRPIESSMPTSAADWLRRGVRQLDSRRVDQALQSFERALEIEPGMQEASYNRLLCLQQLRRAAATDYTRFTTRFPDDARGWSMLGQSLAESGDADAALEAMRRAVELVPSKASFRNNLAVTLARLQRFELAGEAFAAVHTIDPVFPDAAYFAAMSFSLSGDSESAATWMVRCLDDQSCDPSRFTTDPNFENLRTSRHWDAQRVSRAIAAWPSRGGASPR